MDSLSLQRFNHLLSKQIDELTQDEISFLRARRLSLSPTQLEIYSKVLKIEPEVVEKKEETTEPKKVTRSKKD
jgi:hypothetical protein